jgi:hypothetical protein
MSETTDHAEIELAALDVPERGVEDRRPGPAR